MIVLNSYSIHIYCTSLGNFTGVILRNVLIRYIINEQTIAAISCLAIFESNVNIVYLRVVLVLLTHNVILSISKIINR